MRQSLARCSAPVSFVHAPSLADFITSMFGFKVFGTDRYVGNLPPMPGVFPDYPAPVVRNEGTKREMVMMRWGMPPPPKSPWPPVTNIRNTKSPHCERG
jgi:putative SOS response-associated peptidase YedK